MRYLRCQCGKLEYYDGGIPPQDCQGCSECGTTYSWHPDHHKPVGEHEWEVRYNTVTGKPDRCMCRKCLTKEKVKVDDGWTSPYDI